MPIINVKVNGTPDAQKTKRIGQLVLDLTANVLGKKPEVTAITLQYIPSEQWFVGGSLLSEQEKNTFYLDIKITDETNTKDQKAAYISAMYDGFEKLLGNIHQESYVYVEDVRATAYGYGGKTQEHRYQLR